MQKQNISFQSAALYRLGSAIFSIACLMNAYDAYTKYVKLSFNFIQGGNPRHFFYEALLFAALTMVIILDAVGLILLKWAKRKIDGCRNDRM